MKTKYRLLKYRLLKSGLLGLASLVLLSCEKDMSDLVQQINTIKAQPAGRITDIPEFILYQNYEYTAQNLRDPFVIASTNILEDTREIIAKITNGIKPDIDRVKEALESFPIDTLRFKGTLTTSEGIKWALIFAPDNTIYRVIEGYHIGQNHGRIFSIQDDRINLTEIVSDGLGNYTERDAALALIN